MHAQAQLTANEVSHQVTWTAPISTPRPRMPTIRTSIFTSLPMLHAQYGFTLVNGTRMVRETQMCRTIVVAIVRDVRFQAKHAELAAVQILINGFGHSKVTGMQL